jgi:hypothetical protein
MPRGRPTKKASEAKKLKETLTPQQIESIKAIDELLLSLSLTFRDCDDLSYSQIVSVDVQRTRLNYLFREVIHND